MRSYRVIGSAVALMCASSSAFAIDIFVFPGPTLAANPAALAAFNRAAAQWESRLSDPIPLVILADIAPLGIPTAQAEAVVVFDSFNFTRGLIAADALDEGADDQIVASLPTFETFNATLPAGSSLNQLMALTKANMKALGVTGLDDIYGHSDGKVTFNSNIAFDYDNSNGVAANQKDFESAAIHEIGHVLGFGSSAGMTGVIAPTSLDLFRFQDGPASVDPTEATFATTPRSLITGGTPIFDDGLNEFAMSSGTDGFQTSHWKADDLSGNYVGTMDPTLGFGNMFTITNADLRAFDLIGYEVTTAPEPAGLIALSLSAVVGMRRRRAKWTS